MADYPHPFANTFNENRGRHNFLLPQVTFKERLALKPQQQTHQRNKDGHTDAYAHLFYGPDRQPLGASFDNDSGRKQGVLQDIMGTYGLHHGGKPGKAVPAPYGRQSSSSALRTPSPTYSLQEAIEEHIPNSSPCPVSLLLPCYQPDQMQVPYIPRPKDDPISTFFTVTGVSHLLAQAELTPWDRGFPPEMCHVCNTFPRREVRQLPSLRAPCGHVFHTICLLAWFLQDKVPLSMACDVCRTIHYNVRFKYLRPGSWQAPTGPELWIRLQRVVRPGASILDYMYHDLPKIQTPGVQPIQAPLDEPVMEGPVLRSYPPGEFELEWGVWHLDKHEISAYRRSHGLVPPSMLAGMPGYRDLPLEKGNYYTDSYEAALGLQAPPGFGGRPMSSGSRTSQSRIPNSEPPVQKRTNFQYRGNAYKATPTPPRMSSQKLQVKDAANLQHGDSAMRRMVLNRNASGTREEGAGVNMDSARQVSERDYAGGFGGRYGGSQWKGGRSEHEDGSW
ncbi:hypothetical protein K491DRAFT_476658 [Lophiostoma macrostomum CBS 122681]|uniref:RING-type domain-containing protein n=1 Tax=Lophiostoma macrostomum CBS 122681 TaxID=1314788 RepID=A0A6A6T2U1_9PLEO|nr:hypothetical protein K491DRAFT_476658 [Lophiostoma macrostomum CBS 122681]